MTRFLADENISRFVAVALRSAGFDVVTIGTTSSGASDIDVLEIARRERRILITED
jgi:predicted nuclease of predicted toxin-antitoxin system